MSDTTEQRVTRLEGELEKVRRQNRGVLLLLVVFLAATALVAFHVSKAPKAAVAQGQEALPDTIRARAFIAEDAEGRFRAAVSGDDIGGSVGVTDSMGQVRALLSNNRDGPSLAFSDRDQLRMILAAYDGKTRLDLRDDDGVTRANLFYQQDRTSLSLNDRNGTTRGFFVTTKAGPAILLSDESGENIWTAPELD